MLSSCALCASLLLPQDPPAPPPVATGDTQAARVEIPLPRPRPPELPSYRISLRMKTGRRFAGVVSRDRPFHELVHAGAHHRDEVYARPDRFKLRYVDGLDGEIEIRWNQVERLEVRDILDSAGMRAMDQSYLAARALRRAAAERAGAGDPAAPGADGEGTAGGGGDADAAGGSGRVGDSPPAERTGLLAEFPPEAGFTPERRKQIEWRRTVVGTFPDEREQRFLDVFDQWLPEYEAWVVLQSKAGEDAKKPQDSAPPRAPSGTPAAEPEPAPEPPPVEPRDGDAAPAKPERKEEGAASPIR
jgi:hypothetical protein